MLCSWGFFSKSCILNVFRSQKTLPMPRSTLLQGLRFKVCDGNPKNKPLRKASFGVGLQLAAVYASLDGVFLSGVGHSSAAGLPPLRPAVGAHRRRHFHRFQGGHSASEELKEQ